MAQDELARVNSSAQAAFTADDALRLKTSSHESTVTAQAAFTPRQAPISVDEFTFVAALAPGLCLHCFLVTFHMIADGSRGRLRDRLRRAGHRLFTDKVIEGHVPGGRERARDIITSIGKVISLSKQINAAAALLPPISNLVEKKARSARSPSLTRRLRRNVQ
eukprot:g64503.t1